MLGSLVFGNSDSEVSHLVNSISQNSLQQRRAKLHVSSKTFDAALEDLENKQRDAGVECTALLVDPFKKTTTKVQSKVKWNDQCCHESLVVASIACIACFDVVRSVHHVVNVFLNMCAGAPPPPWYRAFTM